jgi:carboxymethylenebutenolidase
MDTACALVASLLLVGACRGSPTGDAEPRASAAPPAPPPVDTSPVTPEEVAFSSGALTLHGFLYRPRGTGPFPALVFNHGSNRYPGAMADEAAFYVAHGFVFFLPHRRGHGRSADAGAYVLDQFEASGKDTSVLVRELVAQADDVMAAVAYAGKLPYVDSSRVSVAGCSYGGIESLFAAERGTGIHAVVDFAGGAMAWAQAPELRERMTQAARSAKVPVFFIQAENDYDTTPSVLLSGEMNDAGRPTRLHVFPPNGTTHQEGHAFCLPGDHPAWGAEVLAFLAAPSASP